MNCCPICDDILVPYLGPMSERPYFRCLKCWEDFPDLLVPKTGILVPISRSVLVPRI